MTTIDQMYWELAQSGKLCDLTLIEKSTSGATENYSVHKLIMYAGSEYFKTLFDQKMEDSNTNTITIATEAPETGLLGLVIKCIYAAPGRAERLYYTYAGEHNIQEIMCLYLLCDFLQLSEHMRYIQKGIKDSVDIGELTRWWRERQEKGLLVPNGVQEMVQKHLQASIIHISSRGDAAYISVVALLNLWPDLPDPVSKSVREFLGGITDAAKTLSKDGNDDPNEWMSEDDEEDVVEGEDVVEEDEYLPESKDHPYIVLWAHSSSGNQWLDPKTEFIFTEEAGAWNVTCRLDKDTHLAKPLSVQDKREIREKGWHYKKGI